MARPIAATPVLRGARARHFIAERENPPPLKPVKLLTKAEVESILREAEVSKRGKTQAETRVKGDE
jgi:hypothetical protein